MQDFGVPDKLELGERIKQRRLAQNLTLKDVELKAQVSATHVSEIERGLTSPTVGALVRIADALGTEAAHLLRRETGMSYSVVRYQERRKLDDADWPARLNRLSSGVRDAEMSLIELELAPRGQSREVAPPRTGEVFAAVLSGVVELSVGERRHALKKGDCLHFDSREPHRLRNGGDETARVVWVSRPCVTL